MKLKIKGYDQITEEEYINEGLGTLKVRDNRTDEEMYFKENESTRRNRTKEKNEYS